MSSAHGSTGRAPPLHALQGFEASARTGSFTAAARELSLTQGAISRQVKLLEQHLGQRLFVRAKSGLRLTAEGTAWLDEVRPILHRLDLATVRARARGARGGVLNLSVPATFGACWLMPRLPGFLRAHPHITVNLTTQVGAVPVAERSLDAAILFVLAPPPGCVATPLMPLDLFPVAAPSLFVDGDVRALLRMPLLRQSTLPGAWDAYFAAAGLDARDMQPGPVHDLMTMGLAGAETGQGAALVPGFLADTALAAGTVRRVCAATLRTERSYQLCAPADIEPQRALRLFGEWIRTEASAARTNWSG